MRYKQEKFWNPVNINLVKKFAIILGLTSGEYQSFLYSVHVNP